MQWLHTTRARLTLLFGGVSLLVALVLATYVNHEASAQILRTEGENLITAVRPVAAALAEGLREREREMVLLSRGPTFTQGTLDSVEIQAQLEEVQQSYPFYSWIGVVDPAGVVRSSTGGLLRDQSVVQRPWFAGGLQGPFLGDAHDAVLLDKLLRTDPAQEPLRFMDFASPIRGADSSIKGVVGSHLNWEWAKSVIASVHSTMQSADGLEVLIVNRAGEYLHPRDMPPKRFPSTPLPASGQYGTTVWGEQGEFLTAVMEMPSLTVQNLGWKIVIRKPMEQALAPVQHLHRVIVGWALGITLVMTLLIHGIARRFSMPLEKLAEAARAVDRTGQGADFRIRATTVEFAHLRDALQAMTEHLLHSQQQLLRANAELEQTVQERTAQVRLREQEYRSILEEQTELICRFRADHTLTYVNDAYCRMFGLRREEVLGQAWAPVVHPEDLERVRSALATITPENPMLTVENRVIDGQGQVRWGQFVNRAMYGARGEIVEWQTVGRDITEAKRLEQEVQRVSKEFQDLYNRAPCGYYSVDPQGVVLRINDLALSWLGMTREEVVGHFRMADFLDEAGQQFFREQFPVFKRNGTIGPAELNLQGRQGTKRRVSLSATAVRDSDGAFLMSRTVMYDVTELHEMRQQLAQLNVEQEAMLDNDLLGIAKLRNRTILWRNKALERIFGYEPGELLGQSTAIMYPSQDVFERFGSEAYAVLESGHHYRKQMEMRKKNGDPIWIDLNGVRLSKDSNEALWLLQDISEMKQYQAQMEHIAFHDPLTNLPNRLLLTERMHLCMALNDRMGTLTAVCYLDLDGFKPVNDQYGHEAGDEVLRAVARRLQEAVRANDTVARLGGDEFALLLSNLARPDEADVVVQRVVHAVGQPVVLSNGATVTVTTSVGVAFYPTDGTRLAQLFALADQAMYAHKKQARRDPSALQVADGDA